MNLRLLALFALTAASSAVVQAQIVCETSGGSPDAFDAHVMANEMRNQGGGACQDRGPNPGCTQIWQKWTAAANICGPRGRCISWAEAATAVQGLVNICTKNGRVGGVMDVSDGMRVSVYHN